MDKYATTYRINELHPQNEYSISLGYIEKVKGKDGKYSTELTVEDVINIRTPSTNIELGIEKISKGKVYFNFKMTNEYVLDSAQIKLVCVEQQSDDPNCYDNYILLQKDNLLTSLNNEGFSSSLNLPAASKVELQLTNAQYKGKDVTDSLNIKKKFYYSPLQSSN